MRARVTITLILIFVALHGFSQDSIYQEFVSYNKGMRFLENSQFVEAIDCFDKAIAIDSSKSDYFFKRGQAYFSIDKFAEAKSDFKECSKFSPGEPEYIYLMAVCSEKIDSIDSACELYAKAMAMDSLQLKYFRSHATLAMKKQRFDKAIEDYDYILSIDKTDGLIYFYRGFAQYKLGNNDAACRDWQSALDNSYSKAASYIDRYCKTDEE